MPDTIVDFGAKLTLVLKRLNQSRGGLASAIGVHKSLVGRWAAGAVRPTDHNLALITQLVQRSIPAFTLLSWEDDLQSFAARLGATIEEAAVAAPPVRPRREDALCGYRFSIGAPSREQTVREGPAYAGLYRLYRQALNNSGAFIVHGVAIRFDGEHLTFRTTDGNYEADGPVLLLRGQLFFMGESRSRMDEMFFAVVNGIAGSKALRLDGLVLAVAGDRTHTPGSMIVVLERRADLAIGQREDEAEWQRWRSEIHDLNMAGRGGELVPPELKAVLENRVGVPRGDGSVDWVLRVPAERSVSIGDTDTEAMAAPGPDAAPLHRPFIVSRS
jgi:hypothetical protein